MISKNICGVAKDELYAAYKLFFNTFSSEHRLKILNLLRKGPLNVGEIVKKTGMEQSNVSHNLGRLRHCGFVESDIKGRYRYYKLNEKTIKPILNLIDKHMEKNCLLIIKKMKEAKK